MSWVEHVKRVQKAKGITYGEALKIASKTYKPKNGKGPVLSKKKKVLKKAEEKPFEKHNFTNEELRDILSEPKSKVKAKKSEVHPRLLSKAGRGLSLDRNRARPPLQFMTNAKYQVMSGN